MIVIEFAPAQSASFTEKTLLTIKLARPRTWVFAIISFLTSYFSGTSYQIVEALLGISIFAILTGATNMINAYTDMEEDYVNNPFRLIWIQQLGLRNLITEILLAYSLVIGLSLLLGSLFTLITSIAILDSIFYSLPPLRFKKHPIVALIAFSGAVSLPFLAGLSLADGTLKLFNPLFLLFSTFMLTYGTVKNIPDYAGDKLAGLKTSTTIFKNYQKAIISSTLALMIPYVVLSFLLVTSALPISYVINFSFLAFPFYWGYTNLQTTKREIKEKIHTYGFLYAVSFLLLNMILTYPSLMSIVITIYVHTTLYLIDKYEIDSRKELPLPTQYQDIGVQQYAS